MSSVLTGLPGGSPTDFASALTELKRVVGEEWVFTSDEDLDLLRDAYSPFLNEPEERIASGAVAPSATEEVQQIVRIANRYRIPLYTISTGKNPGYGGSAPAYSGSVVGNAISSARLKNGEWSVSRVIRSRQGRAACMPRWAGRVMALSAVHSTYMRGTLPNRVAVVRTGVASGANGSDESNDYASTTSSRSDTGCSVTVPGTSM